MIEFTDWARERAYEQMMSNGVDILVEVYNLTRDQQELAKWILVHYPEIQQESLPNSGIVYSRDAARELFVEHDEEIDERFIDFSDEAKLDRQYIEAKYRVHYGT